MFIKTTLFTLLLFALIGCEENFPTYSKFCNDTNSSQINCLNYMVFNKQDKKLLQDSFALKNDNTCPYKVVLTKYKVEACSNPIVKSTGGDFNGYVRVEVKKGFECYFKIQSDYKNYPDEAFERVLKGIKKVFK